MRVYKARIPYESSSRELRFVKHEGDEWVNDTNIWRSLGHELYLMRGTSIGATWQPLPVAPVAGKPGAPVADFSYLFITRPLAITQRAKDALGDVLDRPCRILGEPLGNRGELLPLNGIDGETYYLYHEPIISALDEENSAIYRDGSGYIVGIDVYSFMPEQLEDAWLFQLPRQGSADFYITELFKERVEAAGLTNLIFDLVWDGDDPDYRDERYDGTPGRWEEVKQAFWVSKGRVAAPSALPLPPVETTETALEGDDRESIEGMVRTAVAKLSGLLGVRVQLNDDPKRLVKIIENELERLRTTPLDTQALEHRAIELGVLYGEQLLQAYGWRWAKIDGNFVVVAPDASLYLDPVWYVFELLRETKSELTVQLLFYMLSRPQLGAEAGSYQAVEQPLPSA